MRMFFILALFSFPAIASTELELLLHNLSKIDLRLLNEETKAEFKDVIVLVSEVAGEKKRSPLIVEGILEHKFFSFRSHTVAGIQSQCLYFTNNFDPTSTRTNPTSFNELVVTVNGFSFRKFISQSALWPSAHVCRLISIAIEEFGRATNGYSTKLSLRGSINQLPFHFSAYKRGDILRQCADFRHINDLLKDEDEFIDVSINGTPMTSFKNTKYGWSDMGSCRVIVDYIDYMH